MIQNEIKGQIIDSSTRNLDFREHRCNNMHILLYRGDRLDFSRFTRTLSLRGCRCNSVFVQY
jgi:hypothetical protein